MQLFRLTLATIIQRKVWIVALLSAVVMPIVLPYLTPYESAPTLIEPARAQASWVTLWVVSVAWVLFQASRFGDETSRSGMGAYFLSTGVGRISQMFQIWMACMMFLMPLIIITVAVCLIGAMPGGEEQAKMWVVSNLQYATLFCLVLAPLTLFAIALGSRFGGTVGYIIPVGLCIYGLYGVGYLGMMTSVQENAFLDWLFVLSPHYHLAELTDRLVFKQGSMISSEFFQLFIYFVGLKLVISTLSSLCFRAKQVV